MAREKYVTESKDKYKSFKLSTPYKTPYKVKRPFDQIDRSYDQIVSKEPSPF